MKLGVWVAIFLPIFIVIYSRRKAANKNKKENKDK
jgi:hypothetical protein